MPEIHVKIKLKGDSWPTDEESSLRNKIEDEILAQKLGLVVDAGAGMGVMDLYVKVEKADESLKAIEAIVGAHVSKESSSVAVAEESEPEDSVSPAAPAGVAALPAPAAATKSAAKKPAAKKPAAKSAAKKPAAKKPAAKKAPAKSAAKGKKPAPKKAAASKSAKKPAAKKPAAKKPAAKKAPAKKKPAAKKK